MSFWISLGFEQDGIIYDGEMKIPDDLPLNEAMGLIKEGKADKVNPKRAELLEKERKLKDEMFPDIEM